MKNIRRYKILGIFIIVILIISIVMYFNIYNNKKIKKSNNVNIYSRQNVVIVKNNDNSNRKKAKLLNATLPVFMYHNVSDDVGTDKYVNNYISPSKLDSELKYINDNKYQTIFESDLLDLENYTKPIALTFDDGYENFYTNAYPLLKKYKEKATVNIITKFINKKNYLTTSQIIEMKNSGFISFESHTQTHQDLTKISDKSLDKELSGSKDDLKNNFNIDSKVICYPSGKYNDNVINSAKKYYSLGLAIKNKEYNVNNDKSYEIPRVRINRDISMQSYIFYLSKSSVNIL